jgi:hypothetical protein
MSWTKKRVQQGDEGLRYPRGEMRGLRSSQGFTHPVGVHVVELADICDAPPLRAEPPLPDSEPLPLLEIMHVEGACMSELVWITV